ncbi:MAG: tRNA dihydrouridine synthase DusB [Bacteroidota bacterium]
MKKTGFIELADKPLFLAPMEDITDYSFRHMCKQYGADVMVSEFIASEGLIRDCEKSFKKMKIDEQERPFGIQLYGHRTEAMVEAAKRAEEVKPDFIDLNFGCPAKKIAHRGAGAGLLQNIPLMVEMAEAVVKTTKLPVTAKTRIGWDHNNINILEIAKKLQDVGIQLITIHGRTKAQMYKGKADWETIAGVKHHPEIHIPVVGNGDIQSPEDAKKAFDHYKVDGVMIGRATVGKPWLFKQIKHYLNHGEIIDEPPIPEKVEIAKKHLRKSIEWKGYPRGIYEMRRHLSNYFKGLPNFKEIRITLVTSLDEQELSDTLDYIAEKYNDYDSSLLTGNNFFHY